MRPHAASADPGRTATLARASTSQEEATAAKTGERRGAAGQMADPRGASSRAGTTPADLGVPAARSATSVAPSPGASTAAQDGSAALAGTVSGTGGTAAAPEGTLLGAGVEMQELIDAIRASVQVASRQGIAHARIALQPEELGEIRIHLSQTGQGLLARLTADSPAAAQALLGARSELHRSLSSLGAVLLRLDIGSSGQSEDRGQAGRFAGPSGGEQPAASAGASSEASDPGEAAAEAVPTTVGPKGAILDVFA